MDADMRGLFENIRFAIQHTLRGLDSESQGRVLFGDRSLHTHFSKCTQTARALLCGPGRLERRLFNAVPQATSTRPAGIQIRCTGRGKVVGDLHSVGMRFG